MQEAGGGRAPVGSQSGRAGGSTRAHDDTRPASSSAVMASPAVSDLINRLLRADLEKETAAAAAGPSWPSAPLHHSGGGARMAQRREAAARNLRQRKKKEEEEEEVVRQHTGQGRAEEEEDEAEERARQAEAQLLAQVQRERQEAAQRHRRSRRRLEKKEKKQKKTSVQVTTTTTKRQRQKQQHQQHGQGETRHTKQSGGDDDDNDGDDDGDESEEGDIDDEEAGKSDVSGDASDAHGSGREGSLAWERVTSRAARRRENKAAAERRRAASKREGPMSGDAGADADADADHGVGNDDQGIHSKHIMRDGQAGSRSLRPGPGHQQQRRSSGEGQAAGALYAISRPSSERKHVARSSSSGLPTSKTVSTSTTPIRQEPPPFPSLHFPELPRSSSVTETAPSSTLNAKPVQTTQSTEGIPPAPPPPTNDSPSSPNSGALGERKMNTSSRNGNEKEEDDIMNPPRSPKQTAEGQLDRSLFDALYTNMQRLKSRDESDEEEQADKPISTFTSEHSEQEEDSAWSDKGQIGWSEEDEGPYRGRSEYITERSRSSRQKASVWGSRMTGSLWSETNEWDRSDLTIEQVLKQQARMEGMGEMSITQQLVVALNNQMNEHMNDISRQMESIITVLVALDTKVRHLEDKQTQFHSWLLERERRSGGPTPGSREDPATKPSKVG